MTQVTFCVASVRVPWCSYPLITIDWRFARRCWEICNEAPSFLFSVAGARTSRDAGEWLRRVGRGGVNPSGADDVGLKARTGKALVWVQPTGVVF